MQTSTECPDDLERQSSQECPGKFAPPFSTRDKCDNGLDTRLLESCGAKDASDRPEEKETGRGNEISWWHDVWHKVVLPLAVLVNWGTSAFFTISSKCLVATPTRLHQCTIWGPSPQGFAYPLTAAFLYMLFVSTSLASSCTLKWTIFDWQGSPLASSHPPRSWLFDKRLYSKVYQCLPVGCAFGIKYGIGQWAIEKTPSDIFVLLHSSVLLFTMVFARFLVPDTIPTWQEYVCCLLVFLGTAITSSDLQVSGSISVLGLGLTVLDCVLAGLTVALLRRTMLQLKPLGVSAIEVTTIKLFIAALCVLPFVFLKEGLFQPPDSPQWWEAVWSMSSGQQLWLSLTILSVLVYQCDTTFLCGIASAVTVGVIAALTHVVAYGITVGLTGASRSGLLFWAGSILILLSGMAYGFMQVQKSINMLEVAGDNV